MDVSIDARIVAALDPIAPAWNAIKEDTEREKHEEPNIYFTFQYATHGIGYADDEPTGELALITAYLHAPLSINITGLVKLTKVALHRAGFTWPEKIDASSDKERCIVFEFQDATGVDLDGEV